MEDLAAYAQALRQSSPHPLVGAPLSTLTAAFGSPGTPLAFTSIGDRIGDRSDFLDKLTDRARDPWRIHQQDTPLCGPAAFMYCLASEFPDHYKRYVLELALTGEGSIGKLRVTPGQACRQADLSRAAIHPVDWVALASLRDSSNALFAMNATNSNTAGITAPAGLKAWFDQCGLFAGTADHTRSVTGASFDTLLEANISRSTGAYVCMLLRAAIMAPGAGGDLGTNKFGKTTPKTASFTPDHWVVMRSSVTIGHLPAPALHAPRPADMEGRRLSFSVYSWGATRPINERIHDITPEKFLPYFYGYVSARA